MRVKGNLTAIVTFIFLTATSYILLQRNRLRLVHDNKSVTWKQGTEPFVFSNQNLNLEIRYRFNKNRTHLANNLRTIIQKRLEELQNPNNCTNKKFLACDINFGGCGFGCQIHHIVYCLCEAFVQNRTLILNDDNWFYHKKGFANYFLPLTSTCQNESVSNAVPWNDGIDPNDLKKIYLGPSYYRARKIVFPQYFIPKDYRWMIRKFHNSPFAWWCGQMLKYIMRLQPEFGIEIETDFNLKNPIVGIHVRRSDKNTEADLISLQKYLQQAENFFKLKKIKNNKNIYLASDDASVISETSQKQNHQYNFIYNNGTNNQHSQKWRLGLKNLLKELYALRKCDFVVCTFSSNLCRLIYELKQADASFMNQTVMSLDSDYFFEVGSKQIETAIEDHIPENENQIELQINDTISIHQYIPKHLKNPQIQIHNFNGYKNGTNLRTNKTGLYPFYKTIE